MEVPLEAVYGLAAGVIVILVTHLLLYRNYLPLQLMLELGMVLLVFAAPAGAWLLITRQDSLMGFAAAVTIVYLLAGSILAELQRRRVARMLGEI